ncbi:MAG: tetratricopeptide repeat protein [Salibacteraceae bacterium]
MIKILRICVLMIALVFTNGSLYSQATTDSQLAAHYYQEGDFEKAALYYKRLYDKDHSGFHYNYYLKCLTQLEDFDSAEKLVKFHSRLYPDNFKIKVDLGVIYTQQGKTKQANKEYDKLISKIVPNYESVKGLADAFIGIEEYELALACYKKAESFKTGYPYNIEKAEIFALLGDKTQMIDELLALLELNNGYLNSVQTSLTKYSSFDQGSEQNEILKTRLIKKINQFPNKVIYSQLLLWLYQQEGNWKGALTQAKALDKRKSARGQLVYNMAEILLNNEEYDICAEACNYVIDKGQGNPFYIESRILILECRNQKVTKSGIYSDADVELLLGDYSSTISELGTNSSTVTLLQEKANILSFYKNDLDSGLNTYEAALAVPGVDESTRGYIKLDYGDALVAAGFVWDAALVYGQVDVMFKYDRLGEMAKLKSAQVKFYTGNFSLAKAQLDILKGSTSKLISNDAMELSILITDNSTIDTTTEPLKLYADASLLLLQNRTEVAIAKLDSINRIYPGHALDDDILFLRYEIEFNRKEYEKSLGYLEKLISGYSYDILADKAVFHLAKLYDVQLNDKVKAQEYYQVILLDFKDSLYATEARKRFRELRGDNLN